MFKNMEIVCYEPDSSPEAWEHYKKYYNGIENGVLKTNFNFEKTVFYNSCYNFEYNPEYDEDRKLTYVNMPILKIGKYGSNPNRLFALANDTKSKISPNGIEYFASASRLGGECDFNFNEQKYKEFKKIIGNNDKKALQQLEKCKSMHHTLVNFSLVQGQGGLQNFKGSLDYDRWDVFIYELNEYYNRMDRKEKTKLEKYLETSEYHEKNIKCLTDYLDDFGNIKTYCKEIYFIEDVAFERIVEPIIKNQPKKIVTLADVKNYMDLAEKFWNYKNNYFLEQNK